MQHRVVVRAPVGFHAGLRGCVRGGRGDKGDEEGCKESIGFPATYQII